jgi:chromosome segregation ATPase
MLEEELKAQAEKTCIMRDKNDRACYVAGYLGGYEAAETECLEHEKKLLQNYMDQQNKIVLLSQKVNDLQKAYDKQKEINKDQVDELEDWKAGWNTQNMVATEEAWERTKLTGELKRLREDYEKTQALLDKQIEATYKLDQKNTELKEQIEKMKNCKNCANYMISGKCPCFFRTSWCKNWEMAKGVNND